MKLSFALRSLVLFGLSVVMLIVLTLFESALVGMSPGWERILSFLLLVLPAGMGALLGSLSLIRKEGQAGLAITGLGLNALFALFHLVIILFAG
jgi:hypothetical protein